MGRREALALALVLAAACRQEAVSREDLESARVVHFEAVDGVRLEGRVFGDGEVGVVLSHMFPTDQTSWFEFAAILSHAGYRALTYNFRGYCPGGDAGCSEGAADISGIWQDVLGAIDFLRSDGVREVMLVGASMGGTASLVAASQDLVEVGAVVTLSAPPSFEGLAVDRDVLFKVFEPKLFLAGQDDFAAARAAQQFYTQSGSPKRVEILPTSDHGSDLLSGSQAEAARRLVLSFLDRYSS